MESINLKELYGDKYKIGHDPAAELEPNGRKDPWLFIIPCRYGHIYPYSDKLLAVWAEGRIIRQRIRRRFPKLENPNWGDDGEAIFLFPVVMFDGIAEIVKPKRKRQLSREHREKLVSAGTKALRRHKNSILKGSLEAKGG